MAKRKLNKKFLFVLLGSLVLVGAGGAALVYVRTKKNPDQFVAQGDRAMAERNFPQAYGYYMGAINLGKKEASLAVKAGQAARFGSGMDERLQGADVAAFEMALEMDPRNTDALKSLLRHWIEVAQLTARGTGGQAAQALQRVKQYSQRLKEVDPADKQSAAYAPIAVLQSWISNVDLPSDEVQAALDEAEKLSKEDPENPELPYHRALAMLKQGIVEASAGRAQQAAEQYSKAFSVMNEARAGAPKIPMMQLRAGLIYRQLAGRDPRNTAEYAQLERDSLEAAYSMATPESPEYIEIARQLGTTYSMPRVNRLDLAEQIYRDVLGRFPNELEFRLLLSRILSSTDARRDEAIELLSKPVDADAASSLVGVRARLRQQLEVAVAVELVSVRIESFIRERDPARRTALSASITESLQKLSSQLGNDQTVLRLRGRWAYSQNRFVEAIQHFSKAKTAFDTLRKEERPPEYWEMTFTLARSYVETQQTGPAKNILLELIAELPQSIPPRALLAQLYAKEGNRDGAMRQIAELEKLSPNNPEVRQLKLALMDREQNPDAAREEYAQLPEGTVAERLRKARTGAALQEWDDAIRILNDGLREKPGDSDLARLLVQVYITRGNKEKALSVLEEALTANPQDVNLQYAKRLLNAGTPEQLRELQNDVVESTADEYTRELRRARLAQLDNDTEKQLEHLNKAASLRPDDPTAAQLLFEFHIGRKDWTNADNILLRLTRMNVDQADGLLFKYRLDVAKGELDAAAETARELTRRLPQFSQSWLTLGQAMYLKGDFEQAVANYTLAIEKQRNSADAFKGLIDSMYRLARPVEARRYITEARTIFPNDPMFRELELQHELSFGDPEKAVGPREEIAKNNPLDANAQAALVATYLRVSRTRLGAGDAAAADAMAEKAYLVAADAVSKFPTEVRLHAQALEAAFATGRPARVEQLLKALSEREEMKGRREPKLLLADFYSRTGQADQAEAAIRSSIELDPEDPQGYLLLANFYQQNGKFDQGIAVIDGFAKSKDSPQLQRQLVELKIRSGKLEEAEKVLRAALDRKSNDVDSSNLLTFTLLNQGKFDEALTQVSRTLSMERDNTQAIYYRGLTLMRMPRGNLRSAIEDFETVRVALPDNLENRMALADAYRKFGDVPASITELQSALRLSPQNKVMRLRLVEWLSAATPPRWSEVERVLSETRSLPALAKDPDIHVAESNMWMARKEPVKAIAAAQMAMKDSGGNPGYTLNYLGVLLNTERLTQLMSESDAMLKAGGENIWWLHSIRGAARAKQGDKPAAIADFERAIAIASEAKDDGAVDNIVRSMAKAIGVDEAVARIEGKAAESYRWRMVKAVLLQSGNKTDEATAAMDSVMKELDKMPQVEKEAALRLAGSIYLSARPEPMVTKAVDAYRQLLQLTPNDLAALNNIAVVLMDLSKPPQPAEALVYSTRAFELMRASGQFNPLLLDTHGWVLANNGRVSEAISYLEQALDISKFPEGHIHLGICFVRSGLLRDARRELNLAKVMLEVPNADPQIKAKYEDALAELEAAEKKEAGETGAGGTGAEKTGSTGGSDNAVPR